MMSRQLYGPVYVPGEAPGPPTVAERGWSVGVSLLMIPLVPLGVVVLHAILNVGSLFVPEVHDLWKLTVLIALPGSALVVSHRRAMYWPVPWYWWYGAYLVSWYLLLGLLAGELFGRKARAEQPRSPEQTPTDMVDWAAYWVRLLGRRRNPLKTIKDLVILYAKGKPIILDDIRPRQWREMRQHAEDRTRRETGIGESEDPPNMQEPTGGGSDDL